MISRQAFGAVLAGLVAAAAFAGVAGAASNGVSVTVDRSEVSTKLGDKFGFHSTITNRGSKPATGLVAHLNVLSFRAGVYVDPEDWSSRRTRYLAPIPVGRSVTINWGLHAVNHGSFGAYVAVLPQSGSPGPPTTGPAIHVAVAERKTLNSGGILPLALGIPAFVGLLALSLRVRRGPG